MCFNKSKQGGNIFSHSCVMFDIKNFSNKPKFPKCVLICSNTSSDLVEHRRRIIKNKSVYNYPPMIDSHFLCVLTRVCFVLLFTTVLQLTSYHVSHWKFHYCLCKLEDPKIIVFYYKNISMFCLKVNLNLLERKPDGSAS